MVLGAHFDARLVRSRESLLHKKGSESLLRTLRSYIECVFFARVAREI